MKTYKLLVNNPQGLQEITTVNKGGGYFEKSRVLWDERDDGPMPALAEDNVGGMVKVGDKLQVNSAMLDAANALKAAKEQAEQQKRVDRREAKARLDLVDWSDMTTVAKLKGVLRDIHKAM